MAIIFELSDEAFQRLKKIAADFQDPETMSSVEHDEWYESRVYDGNNLDDTYSNGVDDGSTETAAWILSQLKEFKL